VFTVLCQRRFIREDVIISILFVFANYLTPIPKYYVILFSGMSLNYLSIFMLLFAISLVALMSSSWALASPTPNPTPPALSPTPYVNTSRFVYAHGESMCTFDPNLGCAVGVKNVSGLVVLDKQTEQIYKVQPFKDGLPLCSDPAYVVGALGSSCYDDDDDDDDDDLLTSTPKPISPLSSTLPEPNSQ
jgi:hypothetical protein